MMIRKGRFPIELSNASGFEDDERPSEHLPNDTSASTGKTPLTVITGINGMSPPLRLILHANGFYKGSGKSTYLKQIALITVLAHCGSYVPAEEAVIPLRDRLCCRIGNADDQEHNISTFLLEMKETAFICKHATSRSLVLVDELGRATSNEDGVAIAWATAEFLLQKQALTFFVTHYPQLSCLATVYPGVQNVHLEASVSQNSEHGIQYTHKLKPGACTVSTDYGVELAAACGWPPEVVDYARDIQDDVKSQLPNETFCESATTLADNTQTLAMQALDDLCSELESLFQKNDVKAYNRLRLGLSELSKKYLDENEALTKFISRRFLGSEHDSQLTETRSIGKDTSALGNSNADGNAGDAAVSSSSSSGVESDSDDDSNSTEDDSKSIREEEVNHQAS